MAFEVARVHRLICSRVGDDGVLDAFKTAGLATEADQSFSQSCGLEVTHLQRHYPAGSLYDSGGFDPVWETNNLSPESSSTGSSTETESDEDDDLFENLAQQIAQSMLEEDTKSDTRPGVLEENALTEARHTSNLDVSEGRLSPSSWSSRSWSSGLVHSGSQGSSKGSSTVSSPSSAPSSGYQDAWDTLYAAAGEVVRLKMNAEKVPVLSSARPSQTKVPSQALRAHLPQQTRPSGKMQGRSTPSHSARRKEENLIANNQAQQNWATKYAAMNATASQGRSQYPQYQRHQQVFNLDGHQGVHNYRQPGKLVDSKALQRTRQNVLNGGSGVRVVFLGGASGRESGGTGVFLPRTFISAPDHKKKNEVPPMSAPIHGYVAGAPMHSKSPREGVWPTLQQSMSRSGLRQPVIHEPCLPTEWTY